MVPERQQKEQQKLTTFIDKRQFNIPQVALQEAFRELYSLGSVTAEMLDSSRRGLLEYDADCYTMGVGTRGWVRGSGMYNPG